MTLLLSKTYEIVTEASAAQGDAEDRGFEYEDREVTAREAISALRECSELSAYPVTPLTCAHVWAETEPEENYRTGDHTSYAYHLKHVDGRELTSRQLYRLYRAAGLIRRIK